MNDKNILLALPDLARRLRVLPKWLRDEADAGRIPHLKAGRQRLFNLAAVEATLALRAGRSVDKTPLAPGWSGVAGGTHTGPCGVSRREHPREETRP